MGNQPNDAFLQLVQANRGIIFKICNAYCKNKSNREDLAQEIIYQLWKSGKSFNSNQVFSTWMYRVALNVAITFYRKETKLPKAMPLTDNMDVADDLQSDAQADILQLQQFIRELKELDRALMLLYLEAKSHAEIAVIMGITETNVATKMSRVKEKLRQKFAQSG